MTTDASAVAAISSTSTCAAVYSPASYPPAHTARSLLGVEADMGSRRLQVFNERRGYFLAVLYIYERWGDEGRGRERQIKRQIDEQRDKCMCRQRLHCSYYIPMHMTTQMR